MASTEDSEPGPWTRLPGMAKLVMLTETVLIFFLSFWLYEEWISNPFMQTYASDLIQAEGSTIAIIALLGVVAGLVAGVLRMRRKSSSLWGRTVGTVVPTVAALSPAVKRMTEPFHPVVAALKAAISGTGMVSQTVQPPQAEETSTQGRDQAAPLPGTGPPPVGVAIALLRTLLARANPVPEKTEGERAPESAGSEKPDTKASVP